MNFQEYLQEEGHVQLKQIPYYLKWVDIFKQHNEDHERFLAFMKKSFQDWQVSQGLTAVQMYRSYVQNKDTRIKQEEKKSVFNPPSANKILKKGKEIIRLHGLSYRTEKTYLQWLKRFLRFLGPMQIQTITELSLKSYLTNLCVQEHVSSATQTQAFNALLFFFRNVFNVPVKDLNNVIRSRKKQRLPVVLQKEEIQAIFSHLTREYLLICKIIYGGGLRLNEALSLRIKDIDLKNRTLTVRSGKGDKDRIYDQLTCALVPGAKRKDLWWFLSERLVSVFSRNHDKRRRQVQLHFYKPIFILIFFSIIVFFSLSHNAILFFNNRSIFFL